MAKLQNSQRQKKFVIINTRTHSGEAASSWVLDGLLMEVGECRELEEWLLAENVTLKIVPMLNPDGVFIGNYRTGIVGDDFNRRFHSGRR
jgi:murein tripeptide amidase MpaA